MPAGPSARGANAALTAVIALMRQVRIHTGDPGVAGDDNRTGTAAMLTAGNWDTPDVSTDTSPTYGATITFGVLSSSATTVVTYWSAYDSSGNFVWSGTTATTSVPANAAAVMNTGTLGFNWSTALAADV